MLSGELATLLTGRTVEFEIFPFSFKESVDFMALNNIECVPDDFIKDYIKWGGFPLRFSFREETSIKRFLDNLYSNIINRDIIKKSSKMDKIDLSHDGIEHLNIVDFLLHKVSLHLT